MCISGIRSAMVGGLPPAGGQPWGTGSTSVGAGIVAIGGMTGIGGMVGIGGIGTPPCGIGAPYPIGCGPPGYGVGAPGYDAPGYGIGPPGYPNPGTIPGTPNPYPYWAASSAFRCFWSRVTFQIHTSSSTPAVRSTGHRISSVWAEFRRSSRYTERSVARSPLFDCVPWVMNSTTEPHQNSHQIHVTAPPDCLRSIRPRVVPRCVSRATRYGSTKLAIGTNQPPIAQPTGRPMTSGE